MLTTGVVASTSSGGAAGGNNHTDQSSSQVNTLGIDALGMVTIDAEVLTSNTQCQCTFGVPACTGSSNIVGLVVTTPLGNLPITVTGNPNQVVPLPLGLGSLTLNGRVSGTSGPRSRITATALIVDLNILGLDATHVRIADSDSGIYCGLAPSASEVSVRGVVTDPFGRGVPGAVVRLQDTLGNSYTARTSSFGYFRFDDVEAGRTYIASVSHKRYTFDPQVVSVEDDVTDLVFVALTSQ